MTLDPKSLIESGGLVAIGAIIFSESGLLVGFFLPGDTLLFTAGFFAAQGKLSLPYLLIVVVLAAIVGYEVGYEIGSRFGKKLFEKKDGLIFKQEYIQKAEAFYEKTWWQNSYSRAFCANSTYFHLCCRRHQQHGTAASISSITSIGAVPWCVGISLLGYWLGSKIPNVDHYLLPIIGIIMIISFASPFLHLLQAKMRNKKKAC